MKSATHIEVDVMVGGKVPGDVGRPSVREVDPRHVLGQEHAQDGVVGLLRRHVHLVAQARRQGHLLAAGERWSTGQVRRELKLKVKFKGRKDEQ